MLGNTEAKPRPIPVRWRQHPPSDQVGPTRFPALVPQPFEVTFPPEFLSGKVLKVQVQAGFGFWAVRS